MYKDMGNAFEEKMCKLSVLEIDGSKEKTVP